MTPGRGLCFAALAGLAALGPAQAAEPANAVAGADVPRAYVRHVPERYDDIIWENDRAAYRIYGPALEAREPPSSSGVDAWAKRVRRPFMDRQLKSGDYHRDHGEGLDFYDVKGGRGVGGLGVWDDNKLWTSRNWKTHRILRNGPDVAAFEVTYAPWPVGVERRVWETRSVSLPLGTNFTRMTSTLGSDRPEPLIVGVGLSKRGAGAGTVLRDAARGVLSFWEPAHATHGTMGVAVVADPAMVVGFAEDADNYLILLRVMPGRPFVYYAGAAWNRGLDFHDRDAWQVYVLAQARVFETAAGRD